MEVPTGSAQDPTTPAIEKVTETLGGAVGPTALAGLGLEGSRLLPDPEVPANIHDLIRDGLTDADMPGGATRKCYINGHPGLLERYAEGTDVDAARDAIRLSQELDLPITPTVVVAYEDEPHFVTRVVNGEPLDELLPAADPELLAAVDVAWSKMTASLMTAYQTGKEWPSDIEGPHQWMLGTLDGDTQPRLWMVDLPTHAENLMGGDAYGRHVLDMLNSLYDIEQLTGARMTSTRLALAQAIGICPDSQLNGDAVRNAAYHCLLYNRDPHQLELDPNFLPSMRRV